MSEPTEQEQPSETAKSIQTSQDLPDPELVAQYVQVVPTPDIVRAVYDAIEKAQQHLRENWRKHPQEEKQP